MRMRRPRRWMLGLIAAGAAAGTAAAGCGPGFDPPTRLLSLRVLAIRSEPVAPATGETTLIDAKVYTTDGVPPAYAWSWCPFAGAPGAPCPLSEEQATALAGVPVSYDLGSTAQVPFTNAIPPAIFESLCAGMPGVAAPDCTDGFPIEIRLTVTTSDDEVMAVRPLRLRFHPEHQANANPTLNGLFAVIGGAMIPVDAAATPVLPRHEKTVVSTPLTGDDSELYNGKDADGNPAAVRERLNLSWFVETGDVDHQRTTFIDGQTTLEDAGRINWTPAFKKNYAPDTAKMIVILRDDREGIAWAEGAVTLEPTP
jgi:hypothetical protein